MNLIFTSLVISLLASGCIWVMGRRDPAGRPWLTVICLLVLLMLPGLAFLPKWHLELLGRVVGSATSREVMPWWLVIWGAGVVLMVLRIVVGHIALRKWVCDSEGFDGDEGVRIVRVSAGMLFLRRLPELRIKSGLASPVVSGLWRPVILMPEHAKGWSEETFQMAILHELGHLERRDLWVRHVADIVCALHWYNPLVWWMRSKLLSQCEYACDARVIATGVDARVYVRALCEVVENAISQSGSSPVRSAGVCAMADHAPLTERVGRLMHGAMPGKPWLAIVAALLTVGTALGLTLVRPAMVRGGDVGESVMEYSEEEIELRHSADPFPGS